MTHQEFVCWQIDFRKVSGLRVDEAAFTDGWWNQLQNYDLRDAMAALKTLPADDRVVPTPPRDRLPIVLEHVREARARRQPKFSDPTKGKPVPEKSMAWDQWLLDHNVITRAEFNRRRRERERVS